MRYQIAVVQANSRRRPLLLSARSENFDDYGCCGALARLVRVSAAAGHLHAQIREPDDLMHESRFKTWAVDFPYR